MAKTMKTTDDAYEPDPEQLSLTVRPVDHDLDQHLTGKPTVERIALALRSAAFDFEPDDLMLVATAETLAVEDADAYAQGYDLLAELSALETRISTHYARFDKPLNFLIGVVRKLKSPQVAHVTPIKQSLSKRLGAWKAEQDRLDRERAAAEQAAADLAAKAAQDAKAATLERIAAAEANPILADAFRSEAATVRAAEVKAAPVEVASSTPTVAGGYTRTTWKCEVVDLKELLRAYVEGRCYLDEQAIIDGLQASMDRQAASLTVNMGKAFPGTRAVPSYGAVARKR